MRGIFIYLSDDLSLVTAQDGCTYKALFNGHHGVGYDIKVTPYQKPVTVQKDIKIYGVAKLYSSR